MQIERYIGRISGPLLDRIDIHIEVPNVPFRELSDAAPGTDSATMRGQVQVSREIQTRRFVDEPAMVNGKMSPKQIRQHCQLQPEAESLLRTAMDEMGLSARAHDKILRVSRTIADLEKSDRIESHHLSEAINFRTLDRNYWQ
jgi:magnesium chelatase family protein